jgi:hypothetical protein
VHHLRHNSPWVRVLVPEHRGWSWLARRVRIPGSCCRSPLNVKVRAGRARRPISRCGNPVHPRFTRRQTCPVHTCGQAAHSCRKEVPLFSEPAALIGWRHLLKFLDGTTVAVPLLTWGGILGLRTGSRVRARRLAVHGLRCVACVFAMASVAIASLVVARQAPMALRCCSVCVLVSPC